MGDDRSDEVERPIEAGGSDTGVATQTDLAGMEDMVSAQKQHANAVKRGEVPSGVTGELGKVELVESREKSLIGKSTDEVQEGKSFKTPNGTQVEAYPDGSATVVTPDGKVRHIDKQGKVFEQQSDGSSKEVQNSGISMRDTGVGDRTVVIKNADGSTTEIAQGSGHTVTDYGNGKTVSNFEGGTQHTDLPGRRIIEHPPEKPYELHDNGVIVRPSPGGKPEPSPGGSGEWRTETMEDGSTKYVNSERGEVLVVKEDGSYVHHHKDQNGTEHRVSYDGYNRSITDEYNERYESNGGGVVKHRIVKGANGGQEDTDGSVHPNKKR